MKQVEGIWVPDNDPTSYFQKTPKVEGLPTYQFPTLEAALKLTKDERVVVDGGAHVGLWSMHLMRYFDHVLAFEPNPTTFECLHKNVELTRTEGHSITLYHGALSNTEGSLLLETKGKSVSAHVVGGVRGPITGSEKMVRVACHKLDTFNLHTVDLIKLDVEGHEFEALTGALETLKRCRPVVVIEEKHDQKKAASRLLTDLGMIKVWSAKHDHIFVWK